MSTIPSEDKTSSDVTRAEWEDLAEAAIDLLSMTRFLVWMCSEDMDGSEQNSIDKMAFALDRVGLPQQTQEQLEANIEELLKSGLSLKEWRARRDIMNSLPEGSHQ